MPSVLIALKQQDGAGQAIRMVDGRTLRVDVFGLQAQHFGRMRRPLLDGE